MQLYSGNPAGQSCRAEIQAAFLQALMVLSERSSRSLSEFFFSGLEKSQSRFGSRGRCLRSNTVFMISSINSSLILYITIFEKSSSPGRQKRKYYFDGKIK